MKILTGFAVCLILFGANEFVFAKGQSCKENSDCASGCMAGQTEADCHLKSAIKILSQPKNKECRETVADVVCVCYSENCLLAVPGSIAPGLNKAKLTGKKTETKKVNLKTNKQYADDEVYDDEATAEGKDADSSK